MIENAESASVIRRAYRAIKAFSQRNEIVLALYRSLLERGRLTLPIIQPEVVAPEIASVELPAFHPLFAGEDAPLTDLFFLIAAAKARKAKRILEVGTYRARSTAALHQNCPGAKIISYDIQILPSRYRREVELSARVELRHASFSAAGEGLRAEEPFDFIFIDGGHQLQTVIDDSLLAFDILDPKGMILWHDYRLNGYFTHELRVPEALEIFRKDRRIYHVCRTTFAAYCPALEPVCSR